MKLVALTARRKFGLPWVCLSCRGIKRASSSSESEISFVRKRYTSPSSASLELQECGPARTRFAPSPTGYLHLGSMRTALFNYMVAKASGGQFLLRLEDTDQKRTIGDSEERIYQDLEWAGIEWDEGPKVGGSYGPYKQSERTALYREYAEKLLDSGHAYRCFCASERLRTLADHRSKLGLPPDYDRTCAHIPKEQSDDRASKGDAHVVRLLMPDKISGFKDLVYGKVGQRKVLLKAKLPSVKIADGSYEDPILLKSDGFPTYHLANVVDDHLMKITHVIRGSEWMSSTPKHLAMYDAFGWAPPNFAHVGLLLDKNRQKLSKRLFHTSIRDLRELGVFPESLTNFLALLGWSHRETKDAMSLEDLIRNASLKFTKGDTVVDFGKLWYLQKRHAARYASLPPDYPVNPSHDLNKLALKPLLAALENNIKHERSNFTFYGDIPDGTARDDYVRSILWADAQNYTLPDDFIKRHAHFWVAPTQQELLSSMPVFTLHKVPALASQPSELALPPLFSQFGDIGEENWTAAELKNWIETITQQTTVRSQAELKKEVERAGPDLIDEDGLVAWTKEWNRLIHKYIRWALMAAMPGPNGAETMKILGREETLRRFRVARKILEARAEEEKMRKMEEANGLEDGNGGGLKDGRGKIEDTG